MSSELSLVRRPTLGREVIILGFCVRRPPIEMRGFPTGSSGITTASFMVHSLGRLGAAVDAFKEAFGRYDAAIESGNKLWEGAGERLSPEANWAFEVTLQDRTYWTNRAEIAAKAAVLEADQMLEALRTASKEDARLEPVLLDAEAANPDLGLMRDAVAHLDARTRGMFNRRKGKLPDRGGVTWSSDLFLWQGQIEADRYLLPLPGPGDVVRPGVFLMTDEAFANYVYIFQRMAAAVANPGYSPSRW